MQIKITEAQYEKLVENLNEPVKRFSLTDLQVKSIEDLNKGAKFITCTNCRKKFTQLTHKKKKSLPICPTCGTHVQQKD
jgi:formylmethanofuran dehydrogenase subunit E